MPYTPSTAIYGECTARQWASLLLIISGHCTVVTLQHPKLHSPSFHSVCGNDFTSFLMRANVLLICLQCAARMAKDAAEAEAAWDSEDRVDETPADHDYTVDPIDYYRDNPVGVPAAHAMTLNKGLI